MLFLQLAAEADLFVIWRLGPYINAEWLDGGYPAWVKVHCSLLKCSCSLLKCSCSLLKAPQMPLLTRLPGLGEGRVQAERL